MSSSSMGGKGVFPNVLKCVRGKQDLSKDLEKFLVGGGGCIWIIVFALVIFLSFELGY